MFCCRCSMVVAERRTLNGIVVYPVDGRHGCARSWKREMRVVGVKLGI